MANVSRFQRRSAVASSEFWRLPIAWLAWLGLHLYTLFATRNPHRRRSPGISFLGTGAVNCAITSQRVYAHGYAVEGGANRKARWRRPNGARSVRATSGG